MVNEMPNGSQTTTRKVEVQPGVWKRLGIYKPDMTPAIGDVEPDMNYLAKMDGEYIPVRAGKNQLMYPIERLQNMDPRAEEARRIAANNGFDLDKGQYII